MKNNFLPLLESQWQSKYFFAHLLNSLPGKQDKNYGN